MEAKIGKSYLTKIPHEGREISFQHPSFRGTYGDVAEQIDKENLKRPTSSETASLVYDAFQNPDGKYESEIIQILKSRWFWEFTGNLYIPKSNEEINNGVIIVSNPEISEGKLNLDKSNLVKRLQEGDASLKFVPFRFKIGEQTTSDLEKNPYIIARYGKEGAQKIAKVASRYKKNSYLWSFNSVEEEKTRMSALDSIWGLGGGLSVNGNDWDDGIGGRAFGVCTPEKVK